jgi:hypothetical protein
MVRNNPVRYSDWAGLAPYDVLDEEDSIALAIGVKLDAKGLDQFDAVSRQSLLQALEVAIESLDLAADEINKPTLSPDAHAAMAGIFGADYADSDLDPQGLKAETVNVLRRTSRMLEAMRGPERRKWALMDGRADGIATTPMTETHGPMIWLGKKHLNGDHRVSVASTLAHEGTHALRNTDREPYSRDYWYVSPSRLAPRNAPNTVVNKEIAHMLAESFNLMNSHPDESQMRPAAQASYVKLIDRLLSGAGEPPSVDAADRADIFQSEPQARQALALRNADSLATLAMQFYRF